jgi:hypothetical protein
MHLGYLGHLPRRVESQDDLLCKALHGVEGRLHCLTSLHGVDVFSIEEVLSRRFVSNTWESSLLPLRT